MTAAPDHLTAPPHLVVIPAAVVDAALAELAEQSKSVVEQVYIQAANGELVNPDSLFLRPDPAQRERAIALPAYVPANVPGSAPAMGIKWISSFPRNLEAGLPRASALIVLNDPRTGFPTAVIEGARISAHRTALSAAVGARALWGDGPTTTRLAVIGTGYIADTTVRVLAADGWDFESITVHDLDPSRAEAFAERCAPHGRATAVAQTAQEALADADLVLLATTAVLPHLTDPTCFKPGAVILHMSLRDLTAEAMAGATHAVDEVTHALRERTSLGLAVEAGLVAQSAIHPIGDYLQGKATPNRTRLTIYSPFGLGSLDIAIAALVLDHAAGAEGVTTVPDFAG